MSRRERIAFLVLVAWTIVGSIGVWAWYQADLSAQEEEQDEDVPEWNEVALLLGRRPPDREEAERQIGEMPEPNRWKVLDRLAGQSDPENRRLAVRLARRFRDLPRPRALLVRLALEDPDAKVQEAARKALAGDLP